MPKVTFEEDMPTADFEYEDDDEPQLSPEEIERLAILEKLGMVLSRSRSEAIDGRANMGVETEWLGDEEYYQGIDDQNRGDTNSAWNSKPAGQGEITEVDGDDTGSTVFLNITSTYVDAAAARVSDMLLPSDDKSFTIENTPIPEMVKISQGNIPDNISKQIEEAPELQGNQEAIDQTKIDAVDDAKAQINEAKDKANKAELRIRDWLEECNYAAEMRLVINDGAKVGAGILKGPIPEKVTSVAFIDGKLVKEEGIKPVSRRISYWNFFPDPACGDSIHNGSYTWERDTLTTKQLSKLMGAPGYIDDQIERILDEGPYEATKEFKPGDSEGYQMGLSANAIRDMFEVWYYYGQISKKEFEAAGAEVDDDTPSYIDVSLTMVNNRVIKAVMNMMDTGDFPYDVLPWKKRERTPWGIGVAREIRVAQDIVNGAMRNMMDNAGLAGGPMWIYTQGLIEPEDGIYEIAPRKGWYASDDSTVDDVRKAFTYINMDMYQDELQSIVQLGLKLAEDVTGLPMILQGQQGKAPDTVGGMQILNANASTILRRIARMFDDYITEPHVRRYYRYLLQFGQDDEKGEFVINARGSSALVEKEMQSQAILQLGQMSLNPVYKIDPAKYKDELLKAWKFDPKKFNYDDPEWQQIVEGLAQQAQTPPDTKLQEVELKATSDAQNKEAQRAFDAQQKDADRFLEEKLKAADIELEREKFTHELQQQLEKTKAKLAETTMKLQVQAQLSREANKLNGSENAGKVVPPVAKPASEPTGKAPAGQSFTK